jgi:two-component system LytT family response regulator
MIKALIVEDQPPVAGHLITLIERNFADIEVVQVCDTVKSSLDCITLYQPELVFLDVELHKPETSFDILARLSTINFKIIFTTAYDQYAMQAIKFSAVDYLLKPINEDDFRVAIKKYIAERNASPLAQRDSLLSYLQDYQQAKIGLPNQGGYELVHVKDIMYCAGESAQAMIYLIDGKKELVSRTLKECEEMLEKFSFCRIHKSYVVNLQYVRKYVKGDGGYVVLTNGTSLDVSKSYKDEFLSHLQRL